MSRAANLVQSRFRGALVGVLVGDCCGAPFEGSKINPTALAEQLDSITKGHTEGTLKYTDDTAMSKSTVRSLLANKGFNAKHLAQEYTESYFREPGRGYGAAVRKVFAQLRDSHYQEPLGPAAQQFDGTGSFGNGAAMRCNGIALFAHKHKLSDAAAQELVENCAKITHSHPLAIHGALLLVTAIRYVLALDEDALSETDFLNHLILRMEQVEPADDNVFTSKLKSIKAITEQLAVSGVDVTQKQIVESLGNDVSAQNSVPLAIYSFLRGNSKFIDSYRLENEFVRTLHWAVSCGGDTDTIASMACGLNGAYLGIGKIPESLYKRCEAWQEMLDLADRLAA